MSKIEVIQVAKKFSSDYSDRNALTLSFKDIVFEEGSSTAIVGSSGSGKTTLLNLIAGLSTPSKGAVVISGLNIFTLPESKRDLFRAIKIGYVFQSFNLLDSFSALENVLLANYFSGNRPDTKKATELLKKVGLADRINHKPRQLSMGQQQRVAIARALINDPEIILADEPTGNLDPKTSVEIMDLFMEMTANKTLVMVTHDHKIASRCQRVLDNSVLVEEVR